MESSPFVRVLEQLCAIVEVDTSSTVEALLAGGKISIGDYLISLSYDVTFNETHALIYVDLGLMPGDQNDVNEKLLKMNFEFGAGTRGVMSLHPESNHVFFSMMFPINEASSGEGLLETIFRVIDSIELQGVEPTAQQAPAMPAAVTLPLRRVQL